MWGLIFDLPMLLLSVTSRGGSNRRRMPYHNLNPNRALKSVTDRKVLFVNTALKTIKFVQDGESNFARHPHRPVGYL